MVSINEDEPRATVGLRANATPVHGIDWHFARSCSAIAAVVVALAIRFLLLPALLLLSLLLGGALVVYLYRRGRPNDSVSAGAGIRMGAAAGVMAFVLLMLLLAGDVAIGHFVLHHSMMSDLHDQLQQSINNNPNPQVREVGPTLLTPSGMNALILVSMFLGFAMFLLFCGLGGAVGALLFGRPNKS